MKKKIKYRRYMLFTWYEYDNVEPFSNVHAHSDSLEEIKDAINCEGFYKNERVDEYGKPLYCIFDRLEGVMIE